MNAIMRECGDGRQNCETGMVLLLCLLLLTALTLVGLCATADTVLQSQLSASLQDSERAKQSARVALAWVEHWLLGLEGAAPNTCDTRCDGLYLHAGGSLPPHLERKNKSWWVANGHAAGVDPLRGLRLALPPAAGVGQAYWLIELVHEQINASDTGVNTWYRILVRGTGRNDTSVSVIESTLVRVWPLAGNTPSNSDTALAGDVTLNNCSLHGSPMPCGRVAWQVLR